MLESQELRVNNLIQGDIAKWQYIKQNTILKYSSNLKEDRKKEQGEQKTKINRHKQ